MQTDTYFHDRGITTAVISPSLHVFESRVRLTYQLFRPELGSKEGCVFIGMYSPRDVDAFLSWPGKRYVLFGGSDIDLRHPYVRTHLSWLRDHPGEILVLSESAKENLRMLDIDAEYFPMDLTDPELFYPRPRATPSNTVYIYNGYHGKTRPEIYNDLIAKTIEKRFSEMTFIYSADVCLSHEEMPEVYADCFILLRLTKADGAAFTVQEFQKMGIPAVHNQSQYGWKWNNLEDIVTHIRYAHTHQPCLKTT